MNTPNMVNFSKLKHVKLKSVSFQLVWSLVLCLMTTSLQVELVSKVPLDPIDPVEEWAWGKLTNGLVYFATQTWGGILGE